MAARSAALILLLGLGVGCIQDDGSRFNPVRDMTHVSDDDERELGLRFDQELRKHVRIVEDPVVAGFINDLGQEIVRNLEPQPFVYRFRVVQDPTLNAFAVPGGYVYFHSGTLLAAGSVDELAGVMGHEIAHVKAHHYARMRAKTQIPDLLVGLAGMAAAVATGEPGILVAAQAANVAAQLRFSREFENEADQLGGIFMTRAGYQPAGIARFFERLIDQRQRTPQNIPPYLYSHPDVEDRIDGVEQRAKTLSPTGTPDPRFPEALREVQARLAYLIDKRRESVPPPAPPEDPRRIDPLLESANNLAQEGRVDEALFALARAETLEPHDPRAPYRIGELLSARGRHLEAVAAYRRTVRLDPTRALVFFRMGLAQRALGNRSSAVQAFEQASRRAGPGSNLSKRAEWHIETLIFPVLLEAGFTDGADGGATPYGAPVQQLPAGTTRLQWYARLDSRYDGYAERMRVVWSDPDGRRIAETTLEGNGKPWLESHLEVPEGAAPGAWVAEAAYEGDLLERRSVLVQSAR